LATSLTHVWRILRWGRVLGTHGVLRAFESHRDAPIFVQRLAWLSRQFSFAPTEPEYARAFEKIGPAAIKLGQALATRPDLIGPAAAQNLSRLQDNLPALPFSIIEAEIIREFGAWDILFQSIEETPAGAASIAQVHKAITSDGRTVAVKVLRPGIERIFSDAIDTYQWAAAKIENFGGEAARLRPRLVIETFRQWVNRELDLRFEAGSASELAENMAHAADYTVPVIDWPRTTRRVLTLAWIDGIKLTDIPALDRAGIDRPKLARTLVLTFLKQAIDDGYFHGDLHQGNLFADSAGKLAVVDFGIMGRLDELGRRYLAEILYGLLTRNYYRVAEIHFEAGYVPPHHNVADFATALRAVGEPIQGLAIKDISPARLLDQLFAITRSFDMETQPHLLLLQKSMMMVEGLAAQIDPEANMWTIAEDYLRGWIREELGPEARIANGLRRFIKDIIAIPNVARAAAALVPRQGAAPPQPPLPPLPLPRRGIFWPIAVALTLGLFIGWWI
jgi:ubiquinone biosynthesis protein